MKRLIIFIAFAAIISNASAQAVADTTAQLSIIEHVENWYAENMNYATIATLMAVESSFIPFPSEVVVPPAAYVAGIEGSSLHTTDNYPINVLLVVLFGTFGAIVGAIINYLLAMWLGRPIIYAFADSKLGHLCLLSAEKVKKAEKPAEAKKPAAKKAEKEKK